jgi:hypothetical protein
MPLSSVKSVLIPGVPSLACVPFRTPSSLLFYITLNSFLPPTFLLLGKMVKKKI